MTEPRQSKGPWTHRFLITLLSVVMAVLCFWLLGFVVDDIGSLPGPDYEELEMRLLDQDMVKQQAALDEQIAGIRRTISTQNERQALLRDSTANSQTTMNQLLEFQKLSLQKDVTPSAKEQQALAESQQRFLANQKQYQSLNEEIVQLNEQLRDLESRQRDSHAKLETLQQPIHAEYAVLYDKHEFKMAVLKLSVLVPLLLLAVALFLKLRGGTYAPLIYAFGIAVLLKVALVMHEHFPTRYFKYVLILAALAIVVRILVYLLRMIAHPRKDWLLKQYQEAYELFLCPVCSYPIRRGPLKYMSWTRRTIKKMVPRLTGETDSEEPYTCPTCSTQLYEKCTKCDAIRHSLLPTCQKCGDTKSVQLVSPT
jgi:hypothetical protein